MPAPRVHTNRAGADFARSLDAGSELIDALLPRLRVQVVDAGGVGRQSNDGHVLSQGTRSRLLCGLQVERPDGCRVVLLVDDLGAIEPGVLEKTKRVAELVAGSA